MSLFLAIAGNMGAGKSTLTEILAQKLGARPFLEPMSDNPYLSDFYVDMERWAFHSQLFFLSRRLKEHLAMQRTEGVIIQDRSLYENAEVFARNLYQQGAISERDWQVYHDIYQTAVDLLRPPDLVIYLQASVPSLVERIQRRGRDFERNIDVGYLQSLNHLYDQWVDRFSRSPIVTVPTDDIKYLDDPRQMQDVLDVIAKNLGGLPVMMEL